MDEFGSWSDFDDSDSNIVCGSRVLQKAKFRIEPPCPVESIERSSVLRSAGRYALNCDSDDSCHSSASMEKCLGSQSLGVEKRKSFAIRSEESGNALETVLSEQQSLLSKRRMSFGPVSRRMKRRNIAGAGQSKAGKAMTMKENWIQYLSTVDVDFFSTPEAMLRGGDSGGKGSVLYAALRVTEENNEDMKAMYNLIYKVKHDCGQPTGSYELFRTAVGQFCRMSAALCFMNSDSIYSLFEKGQLYLLATNIRMVEAYVGYFQLKARAATVRSKAVHLKKLSDNAQIHFSGVQDGELRGKASAVSEYLRNVACVQKFQARREHRVRKVEEERVQRGDILMPKDFAICSKKAADCLNGIILSFQQVQRQNGVRGARRFFRTDKGKRDKWCINLIAILILQGGGQRPQVYSQLQLPSKTELDDLEKMVREDGMFEMRTVFEKTPRALDMPHVVFPAPLFRFVKFHSAIVRPSIVESSEVDESNVIEKTLLIHTKSGEPLESAHVTRTLRRFLTQIDRELENVSTMTIRGSYATIMLQFYRQGKIFTKKTEEQFLEYLAKMMNTSVEQLVNAYASNTDGDFRSSARQLTLALSKFGDEGDKNGSCEFMEEDEEAENWARSVWAYVD